MKQKRKQLPEEQQPADGKLLQWHPAFYADLQIEFREEKEKLKFEREYLLSSKPMAIDVLIIKKKDAEPIHKNIGKIFRKYNIIEYKSPSDSLSVDDFYKVYGYTNFYKADTGKVNEIPIQELTITLVSKRYPRELIRHLKEVRHYTIDNPEEGIYYVIGDILPIQILVTNRLSPEKNLWLYSLTDTLKDLSVTRKLLEDYKKNKEDQLYQAVMEIIVKANENRLKEGEPIDKLLYGGYSTISLGYAGLYECVKYMTGKSHTDPDATPFALDVMKHMNDACNQWKEETNVAFSIYGSPIESTTYKFAKCLQKRFGIVPGITDKSYITNSYHVFVREEIDAFSKLKFESQFQALSSGGAISYVEVPDMKDNIAAVLQVIRFIYDNIMYAELNTKSDYCQECGYDGEIQIITDEEGKLVWECPHCGNRNQDTLNVARRTCGYIGTQFWNQGRTQEIKERVLHL